MPAIALSTIAVFVIAGSVSDVEEAGSAASLIFLLCHACPRRRLFGASSRDTGSLGYQSRHFPAVPIVGGLACSGLAVFQALAVPSSGAVVLVAMALGAFLLGTFCTRRTPQTSSTKRWIHRWSASGDKALGLGARRSSRKRQRPRVGPNVCTSKSRPRPPFGAVTPPERRTQTTPAVEHSPSRLPTDAFTVPPRFAPSTRPGDDTPASMLPGADRPGFYASLHAAGDVVVDALHHSMCRGYRPEALITSANDPLEEIANFR